MIDKQGIVHQIANVIENLTNHTYGYDIVGGGYFNDNTEGVRLWTIKDAKDGDILACGDKVTDCPFIFHNLTKELNPRSYCGVNMLQHFQDNDENGGFWCHSDEVRPATKEQRDLLFQKMKEAGYEWDAEKKELKKIHVIDDGKTEMDYCFTKMMTGEKASHTWSDEDESIVESIEEALEGYESMVSEYWEKEKEWLKSLKNRLSWKPSEEQMNALLGIMVELGFNYIDYNTLESLYNDLKKL